MAFTRYQSTDAGAPVLSGTVGALIALLDACLINGYGAKVAAGWSKVWQDAGNTQAIYKPNSTPDFFLKINDAAAGAGLGREALVSAGTAHDGAGNLTNALPQSLSYPNGYYWRKSDVTTTAAKTWSLWADAKTLIFQPVTADSVPVSHLYYAGLFLPYAAGDVYPYALSGRLTANTYVASISNVGFAFADSDNEGHAGFAAPLRADGGLPSASFRWAATNAPFPSGGPWVWGTQGGSGPGPITGVWPFFDCGFFENNEPRGRLRGMIYPYFSSGAAPEDTITVTLNGVARTYRVTTNQSTGRAFIEESDTLDL